MAVIQQYRNGSCTMHVQDNYLANPEEEEKIKKRLSEILYREIQDKTPDETA